MCMRYIIMLSESAFPLVGVPRFPGVFNELASIPVLRGIW